MKDVGALLEAKGLSVSPHVGSPGHYVIERAFVER
jgi:ferredoxin--NADP+ reductase